MRHAIIADGGIAYVDVPLDSDNVLEYVQKTVGGYVELVHRIHTAQDLNLCALANEDGRSMRLAPTLAIKRSYGDDKIITGPVVLFHVNRRGDWVALTPREEGYIADALESSMWHIIVPTLKLNRVK